MEGINDARLEKISDTLGIYQKKGVFSYGTDAVLLSAYALGNMMFSTRRTLFDLCSGTGIVGLMILDRYRDGTLKLDGIEINEDAVQLSRMSAEASGMCDLCSIHQMDIKDVRVHFEADCADFVTVNPPYMTAGGGFECAEDYKNIARHEILCNLSDIFGAAFHLLKSGGSMFIVYRPDRLSTLFDAAKRNHFEIKKMTFVHARSGSESRLVLCRAQKNAGEGLIISRPLYLYGEGEKYSEDYKKIRQEGVMKLD